MARYRVDVRREAHIEIRKLPGHARAVILEALKALAVTHDPPRSTLLDLAGLDVSVPPGITLWRLRLDPWRIVYAVDEPQRRIVVLAIRRRPPYRYEDIGDLADAV